MLTCIARSKQQGDAPTKQSQESNTKNPSVKTLTTQIRDMALKASGVYKSCNPCTAGATDRIPAKEYPGSDWASSERFRWSYRRTGSSNSTGRLKGLCSGEGTPNSGRSGRRVEPVVFVEEREPKEWVAQVETGVLITFVSMPGGGNDLRRIRFSRDMFNKWQAQRWWAENFDKVMELYNVQRYSHHVFPLSTPTRSEDESSKMESVDDVPVTPPLRKEHLRQNMYRPGGIGYSPSDSFDHQSMQSRQYPDSVGLTSTPKLSSISAAKTETSSMDASISRTCSSRTIDPCGDISISNASDLEAEWVEQDIPGVYVTIRALPNGQRELRRVRFSREKFGEMHARVWWEENRARIHSQYL